MKKSAILIGLISLLVIIGISYANAQEFYDKKENYLQSMTMRYSYQHTEYEAILFDYNSESEMNEIFNFKSDKALSTTKLVFNTCDYEFKLTPYQAKFIDKDSGKEITILYFVIDNSVMEMKSRVMIVTKEPKESSKKFYDRFIVAAEIILHSYNSEYDVFDNSYLNHREKIEEVKNTQKL